MSHVEVEYKNNQCHIRLNRPEVRNAFDETMISEMTQVFGSLAGHKDLRVVSLQGAGESFSAGGDLNWMKSMVNYTQEQNLSDSLKLYEMYEALSNIAVPVVTLVHGHAMGGALGLIAASDVVFAVENTQFCFSEVRLGLAPAVISAFVKEKILPRDMARYFLTAEVFEAQRAFDMGLIHDFGGLSEMKELSAKTVAKIAKNSPQAVRATKKMIKNLSSSTNVKKMTTELIAQLRVSDEGQEGLKAFLEKRKPSWLEAPLG